MQSFVFKMGRSKKEKVDPVKIVPDGTRDPELIGFIQGIMPGSIQEYRVAKALDRLGIRYQYQVEIGGGRTVRGGQIVDFVAYTYPLPTPIQIFGEYWHKSSILERFKDIEIKRYFNHQVADTVALYSNLLDTAENTYNVVKEALQ